MYIYIYTHTHNTYQHETFVTSSLNTTPMAKCVWQKVWCCGKTYGTCGKLCALNRL